MRGVLTHIEDSQDVVELSCGATGVDDARATRPTSEQWVIN